METNLSKTILRVIKEQEYSSSNDEKDNPKTNGNFCKLISLLFHSITQVHTFHFQTKTYSEHKALQKYYEGIVDLVDSLVESYQGKYGIISGYENYNIDRYKNTESTIKYLSELYSKIENLRSCCKDSFIQNQIDTLCELINSTNYKLKFLK